MKATKILLILSALIMSQLTIAQSVMNSSGNADHLFATKKQSMAMVATGIPYLGIAEYAYGMSNRTTVGLLVGVTPNVVGYGFRFRTILLQNEPDFRVYARIPFFYYDRTEKLGDEPWVLAWPAVNAEWKLQKGTRISAGAGLVAAACAHSLLGIDTHEDVHHDHSHGHSHHHSPENGFMGGVWNTYQVGLSHPLSTRVIFQAEFATVMEGFDIASDRWVGGPPVIFMAGITYHL